MFRKEVMKWVVTSGRLAFIAVLALTSLVGTVAAAPPPPDGLVLPAEEFLPDSPAVGMTVQRSDALGALTFLAAAPGKSIQQPVAMPADASPETAARAFLGVYGEQFNVRDASSELTVMREAAGEKGTSMVRFQQMQNGLPVLGGELIVNLDAAKNVLSVNGEIVPTGGYDPSPKVASEAALATALEATAKKYNMPAEKLAVSQPALWVYNPIVFSLNNNFKNSLVWRMEVKATNNAPVREFVLVGAEKGEVALSFNQIDDVKDREVYTMAGSEDESSLPGGYVCSEGAASGCAGDTDAWNAYVYSGYTYDYYASQFGRDSIDAAGMKLISSVHFGVGYENAFWNGSQMTYGDGFASALDVVSHEMSHGVTEHTSGLFYWMESGAINEAYSDLHGEFTELLYHPGSSGERWWMGENLSIGAIRYAADPTYFGDPDKISSPYYYNSMADGGGVHTNSGVLNKAGYLMVDGGSFNGKVVSGIGIQKTAAILYHSQTNYLTSASNYIDLYYALQTSCNMLAAGGTKGISAADCAQVKNALDAVEMYLQPGQHAMDDTQLAYTGVWTPYTGANYYYNTLHVSSKSKSIATTTFVGSRVAIHYMTGPTYGNLDVYVDKKKVATINQKTKYNSWYSYYIPSFPYGTHKLTLKHASGKYVNVDAVVARGAISTMASDTVYTSYAMGVLDFKGLWDVGSPSWSYKSGDTVTYYFTGTYFYFSFVGYAGAGGVQIKVDNKVFPTIKQSKYIGTWNFWNAKPLTNKLHKVTIKHVGGPYVSVYRAGGLTYSPDMMPDLKDGANVMQLEAVGE